jgi:hypothetical protein
MNPARVVLCMKWGTLYPAEYVNVLYRACKAHISGDFRFVCLTDESEGLLPDVEAYPIPDIGLEHRHYYDGAWPKIGVFSQKLYDLQGRCLFIDLDTIILSNLDAFFTFPGPLVAIDFRTWGDRCSDGFFTGTGVFAFDIGGLSHLCEEIKKSKDEIINRYKIEQNYVHAMSSQIQYWPSEWVISFKRHLRRPLFIDRILSPKSPPPNARILAFHGKPRPIDLIRPPKGNWDIFPHYGSGPVSWMGEYWNRYSNGLIK